MKFHYFRRFRMVDGKLQEWGIVDVPENQVDETQLINPLWRDMGEINLSERKEVPVVSDLECPICGFLAKTPHGLKIHRGKH